MKHRYERFTGNKRGPTCPRRSHHRGRTGQRGRGRAREHLEPSHHPERGVRRLEAERLAGSLPYDNASLRGHLAGPRRALDRAPQDLRPRLLRPRAVLPQAQVRWRVRIERAPDPGRAESYLPPRQALERRRAPEPGRRDRVAELVHGRGSRRQSTRHHRIRGITPRVRRGGPTASRPSSAS